MNLKHFNDTELLLRTSELVEKERRVTCDILYHLKEIEARSLHLKAGFESLYEFTRIKYKYSEHQAQRRITAMRLLKDLPEVGDKIKDGSLNLTTAGKLQSFIYQAKKENKPLNLEQKQDLVKLIENKSGNETELELLKLAPERIVLKEKQRVLSEEYTEIKITVKKELKDKLLKVKNLLSHKNPNPTTVELLEMMCDLVIKQKEPIKKVSVKAQDEVESKSQKLNTTLQNQTTLKSAHRLNSAPKNPSVEKILEIAPAGSSPEGLNLKNQQSRKSVSKPSRYIPSTVKQEVYMRDKGCCTFKDHKTNQRCNSRHLLQYDHVTPFSFGGATTPDNLRLLCFQHHKLKTQKIFANKMKKV